MSENSSQVFDLRPDICKCWCLNNHLIISCDFVGQIISHENSSSDFILQIVFFVSEIHKKKQKINTKWRIIEGPRYKRPLNHENHRILYFPPSKSKVWLCQWLTKIYILLFDLKHYEVWRNTEFYRFQQSLLNPCMGLGYVILLTTSLFSAHSVVLHDSFINVWRTWRVMRIPWCEWQALSLISGQLFDRRSSGLWWRKCLYDVI